LRFIEEVCTHIVVRVSMAEKGQEIVHRPFTYFLTVNNIVQR